MPKGVDHRLAGYTEAEVQRVQKSLMPKGVDHRTTIITEERIREGAKIFDAERR